jgi:SEC-C motif
MEPESSSTLTATQHQVLAQISAGSTILHAALSAGVHRNTVGYWLRTSTAFRQGLADAQLTEILLWRQMAESWVEDSFNTVNQIRTDPHAPASVRLKAAQMIIDRACSPLPLPKTNPGAGPDPSAVHKNAQNEPQPVDPKPDSDPQPPSPKPQSPAPSAKPGRNDQCPCGSGKKFKRCCLGKVLSATRPQTPTAV